MKITLKPINPYKSKMGESQFDGEFQQVALVDRDGWWLGVTHIDAFHKSREDSKDPTGIHNRLGRGQEVTMTLEEK